MRMIIAILCLTVLVPIAGSSETFKNELGVYTDMTGSLDAVNIMIEGPDLFTAYLVCTNPYNDEFDDGSGELVGRPVEQIFAFECKVQWPEFRAVAFETKFPNGGINFSDEPDLLVGFQTPVLVTNGSAVLVTWTIFVLDSEPNLIYMDAVSSASIPGRLAIYDAEDIAPDEKVLMYPASGSFDDPVFGVNVHPPVVAIENASWGKLKAIFK